MYQHTFRQSWLGTFWNCPEQARAEIAGEVERVANSKMMLGTCVHALIERTILNDGDDRSDLGVIADTQSQEPWVEDTYTADEVADLALGLYELWEREVYPTLALDDAIPERYFSVPVHEDAERTITLNGTADLWTPARIIDWKTSTRPYSEWEYRRWSHQAAVYTLALDVPAFSFCVMQYPKMEVQWVHLERDQHHHEWLIEQLITISRLIESDLPVWPQNDHGWWCHARWCSVWDQCKGAFMPEGWEKA
jgi:hypothetical protein